MNRKLSIKADRTDLDRYNIYKLTIDNCQGYAEFKIIGSILEKIIK